MYKAIERIYESLKRMYETLNELGLPAGNARMDGGSVKNKFFTRKLIRFANTTPAA
jgi:hypothetical protein